VTLSRDLLVPATFNNSSIFFNTFSVCAFIVTHGGIVYLAGLTADDRSATVPPELATT
jgi:hypothetical protein